MLPSRVTQGLGALLALLLLAMLAARPVAAAEDLPPNEVARVLAGLPPSPGSAAFDVSEAPAARAHAQAMDRTWAGLESRQLARIRAWSGRNLAAPRPTLLYMFSGPDFLYANAFFDKADTYIMAGLEPVGRLPQISDATLRNLPSALGGLRASLRALVSYSFFKTISMRTDLRSRTFQGTLPILYVFLARAGKTIHTVQLVELDEQGRLLLAERPEAGPFAGPARGVEIVFSSPGGKEQRLYYFSTDLSDNGIERSGFMPFVGRHGRVDGFVKSASYLMHGGGFSRARQLLLETADTVVQDDSGMPVAYISQQDWELRPFGRYLGPIGLFSGKYQTRLAEVFRRGASPLDFGIGYRYRRNESNLLLALRRSAAHTSTSTTGARP